jgi:DNA-binding XRE family transcriptional regulator
MKELRFDVMGRTKWQPADLEKVKQLAAQGLTRDQIAQALGVCRDTIFERLKDNPDFADAIKEGAAVGLKNVTNALYEAATGGNVTAMIFYLKSRSPEAWSDRQQLQVSGHVEAKSTLDAAACTRAAKAWLQFHPED